MIHVSHKSHNSKISYPLNENFRIVGIEFLENEEIKRIMKEILENFYELSKECSHYYAQILIYFTL